MIRRPPRSTLDRSSAASDVYKRQVKSNAIVYVHDQATVGVGAGQMSRVDSVMVAGHKAGERAQGAVMALSLIHISEPTRPY